MRSISLALAAIAVALLPCISGVYSAEETWDNKTVTQWIAMAGDRDAKIREQAANVLQIFRSDANRVVPALSKLLDDPETSIRATAARALLEIDRGDTARTVFLLTQVLEDRSATIRENAALLLGKYGRQARWSSLALEVLLDDPQPLVRIAAAKALGKILPDGKRGLPTVAELLEDRPEQRTVSGDYGPMVTRPIRAPSEDPLVKMLAGQYPQTYALTADVSRKAEPDDRAVGLSLLALLNQKDIGDRRQAIWTLTRTGPIPKEAAPRLIELLNTAEPFDRPWLVEALGKIGPAARKAVPTLCRLTADDDPAVRLQAIVAIERIGPQGPKAVQAIVRLMHESNPAIRESAELAWDRLGATDLSSIKAFAACGDLSDRENAVEKLAEFGVPSVPALCELLQNEDSEVRRTVMQALRHLGPRAKAGVPAIALILRDKDRQFRSAAAITLGQIGPDAKPAVPVLTAALHDMEGDVRVCAIEALGRIGPAADAATPGLIERLHDPQPPVRSAAARALGQIGPAAKASLPDLEKLRHDPVDYVRKAAEEAMGAISPGNSDRH